MLEKHSYVVGLLFDEYMQNVLLINKNRPDWQQGLLNGPGGKIKFPETSLDCMKREFQEETGLVIDSWSLFLTLHGKKDALIKSPYHWQVDFYAATTDKQTLFSFKKMTDELPTVRNVNFTLFHDSIHKMVPNLYWIIPMALASELDSRVKFFNCEEIYD